MDELVAFLRAALDRDEQAALEATAGPWRAEALGPPLPAADVCAQTGNVTSSRDEPCCSVEDAEHIARWDPARVLAEVQAKRRILDLRAEWADYAAHDNEPSIGHIAETYANTVRLLAQPYAGQPGWRDEWAVTQSDRVDGT